MLTPYQRLMVARTPDDIKYNAETMKLSATSINKNRPESKISAQEVSLSQRSHFNQRASSVIGKVAPAARHAYFKNETFTSTPESPL